MTLSRGERETAHGGAAVGLARSGEGVARSPVSNRSPSPFRARAIASLPRAQAPSRRARVLTRSAGGSRMEFAAVALPLALGIIMFGLGLDLTPADFVRVAKQPKAAAVALACQLLLLPAICFGLVLLFRLPPILAVGMMLLAASPGGTTANLYSHLFRGDVALN